MFVEEYNRLNNIYHFQSLPRGARDLEVGTTYFFLETAIDDYRGHSGRPNYIGTYLRRVNETDIVIRLEEYLNDPVIKLRNWNIRQGRAVYYNEGDEAQIQVYRNEIYRLHDAIYIIPNYVRPERPKARAKPAQVPEPIKTIEVEDGFLFNDTIKFDNVTQLDCHNGNGLAFIIEPSPNNYVGECITAESIKQLNDFRGSEKGSNYFRLVINSGEYNIKKPNWMNNNYEVNDESKGKTFFLEPNGDNTYKLVKLNIRIKTPNQEVEEQFLETDKRETNLAKKSKKGGKRNKRNKNRKTKKRRYRR